MQALQAQSPGAAGMARYVRRSGCFPVYEGTAVRYFPMGEDFYRQLLLELEKAETFIFMEYFIVDEGIMWDSILEILKRKAAAGVDVRLMYDGTCEFALLPRDYPKQFRRQVTCGRFILDFYCAAAKLAIELDGSQHYEPSGQAYDYQRTAYLNSLGIEVLRFSNADVMQNLRGVCQLIDLTVAQRLKDMH